MATVRETVERARQALIGGKADAALASSAELKSHIEFVSVRNASGMPALYADADVFVYPATIESFGHPLLEAMAAGLPIAAADVAINRELCGDAAIYFSPFDFMDCGGKISGLLRDPQLRSQLGGRAYQRSRRFSWERHVDLLLEAFRKLSVRPSQRLKNAENPLPAVI